jgi:hypothetical protein
MDADEKTKFMTAIASTLCLTLAKNPPPDFSTEDFPNIFVASAVISLVALLNSGAVQKGDVDKIARNLIVGMLWSFELNNIKPGFPLPEMSKDGEVGIFRSKDIVKN